MKRIYVFVLFSLVFSSTQLLAQQGVHGPKVVSAAGTVVNEYTAITAFTPAGSTSITVANSALNANGRFPSNLAPGDLIMFYQAQGTIINGPTASGSDTAWGRVDPGNYFSTGYYEFHQVVSVPNATTINIDCGLTNTYIQNGGTARKPEVIRVPRYTTLTINGGGVLTCDPWNGTIGGVLAVEVQGATVINAGGSVDVTGKGFRGGSLVGDNATSFGVNTVASTNNAIGAEKGESVAGYQAEYDVFGGRYGRGAPANGGGGGCGHNAGGGGGANGLNSTSGSALWSGNGIPDQSTGGWTNAWNLEPPVNTMSLRTSTNSSGGGRGGYSFSANDINATTTGPGQAAWGGDNRNHQATGLGGRPMDNSGGRLFLGGGGGAGDQNNSGGGIGGNGGGLVYLMVFGNISGSGTVVANGTNGANGAGGTGPSVFGIDAAGGGGGGGTVVLNAVGGVANTITVNANGGNGGNQVVTGLFSTEAEGPGGGGGGGYIAVSSGTPARNANGGNNGTTNSVALTEFTPNGATKGCPGTNNAAVTNFTITMTNITICTGSSVTLTAVLGGTLPGGVVVDWYTASTGGVPFNTGTTYTTPPLGSTTTYWVGTCPGWWRVPVTVTVGPAPVVTASASPTTICSGSSTTLTAGGAITYNWMPGNINGSSIVVSPSTTTTYTVTGTVSAGCTNTAQVTVTVNPTPTVTASASPSTICAGSSTTLTGSGAASYNWNPGNITGNPITISPAATTTYTVTGTSSGCTGTAQVTVTVNPTPTITSTASPTSICSGGSTTLTGTGGVSYNWNPGNISGNPISVSPATTTTYTVTGTGANGCTNTSQVTVTVNPTPTVTSTASPTTICAGSSTTLTGSGATSYNWNPGNINGNPISVSPATTTTYTVTGTTGGCSSTSQVTVTVNPTPTVTSTAAPTTICAGSSSTLTGGGGVSYTWNPGNISGNPISVTPATTTTYTVTGTGANGCTSTSQVTVTVNPTPTITATASPTSICSGGSTTLTGTGGTSYNWNPGNISGNPISVSPAITTTYTVTGTGANGCTSTAQVTVTVNPTPTVTASASPTTICAGSSTTLTGGGATSYTWNPGNISGNPISVSPVVTTTYTVTGANGGCTSTAQVTVTVNPSPTVTTVASPTTICAGSSATLTGSGAASYVWNPGNISGNPISVTPAITTTYTATGTAANGCTSTSQVTVTVNPTPTVTATSSPTTICAGGSATLTGGGATSYTWNPGNISGSPISVSPALTTTYTVTGTGANGCTSTAQVTVTVNPTPTVTAASAPAAICAGSSATLTGGGATSYTWNPGNISGNPISVSPASTTTYTVTGTGANGCTSTAQVTVTVNPLPTPTATATPNTICVGQTSSLNASGASSYVWNGGNLVNANGAAQTDNPTATTTYTVVATDALGCSANAQVTLTVNPLPTPNAGVDQTICAGTVASLTATGGGTYSWNGGSLVNASGASQTDAPATTTSYIVTVTNGFGCSNNDTVLINVNPLPVVSAGPDVSICPNSSIQITATGASTYLWTPATGLDFNNIPNPTASPTVTTTYVVTGTSAAGCSSNDTIVVTISNNLTVTAGADVIICSGDTVQLSTSGGTIYTWSPSASLQTPNSATTNAFPSVTTTYVVHVTDANNCQGSDSVTVFVNGPVALSTTGATTICIGQSTNITATPSNGIAPYTYNWSNSLSGPGPQTVSPTTTTTYSVSVVDSVGCASPVQTITVNVNPPISVAAIPAASVCPGSPTTLTANASGGDGNLSYQWLPGAMTTNPVTVSPLVTTTYSVIVTDGCGTPADTQTVTVTVTPPPTVSLQSSNNISCFGLTDGAATVLVSAGNGPYTYAWSPSGGNAASATALGQGSYTCTITDANGCIQTQSVAITQPTALQLSSASTPDNCNSGDGTATVSVSGGTPGYTYLWDNSATSSTISNLSAGTYSVTVTDANGCTSTSSAVVGTSGTATADAGTSVTISAGGSTTLNGSGGVTYSWSPGTDLSCANCPNPVASPSVTTTYTLTVTDALGCSATDTVTVFVDADCGDVYLPNAFSPNNDGQNDVYLVRGNCIKYMTLEIYNRWGENVFTTSNQANGWDGTWRGQKCEAAVFTYVFRATMNDGSTVEKQGNISLVK